MCVSKIRIWVPSEVCAAPRNKIVGILDFIQKMLKIIKQQQFEFNNFISGAAQSFKSTQILSLEAYISNNVSNKKEIYSQTIVTNLWKHCEY